jgi:hypothetical protein
MNPLQSLEATKQYLQWVKSKYFRPRLALALLHEEYGVAYEYLPGKKQKNIFVDALSCLEIDSLKIQDKEAESLTLFSGSENSKISNIKLTTPIHTALIFKEQAKVK